MQNKLQTIFFYCMPTLNSSQIIFKSSPEKISRQEPKTASQLTQFSTSMHIPSLRRNKWSVIIAFITHFYCITMLPYSKTSPISTKLTKLTYIITERQIASHISAVFVKYSFNIRLIL